MKKTVLIIFLVVAISHFDFENINGMDIEEEIERRLKLLNKPAVISIESEDGDIIDCVNIYNQPAFDHPALKNHTIQMRPPAYFNQDKTKENRSSISFLASQTWKRSGSCPKGTIPIRRVRRQDLLRVSSLKKFGRKYQHTYNKNDHAINFNGSKYLAPDSSQAILLASIQKYYSARGEINVWNPEIDLPSDFSSSQIWVEHGEEFIESGWIVNPMVYGDKKTRFFNTWTVDAHEFTSCLDLTCPGFVQVNKNIVLGGTISEVAKQEGRQTMLSISLDLDRVKGNWWLTVNGFALGYWPKALFKSLDKSAIQVQWGGNVHSMSLLKNPHTNTDMGNGHFGHDMYGYASFVLYMKVKDNSMVLKDPPNPRVYADEPDCYDAIYDTSQGRPVFFYGGPGGDGYHCYKHQ